MSYLSASYTEIRFRKITYAQEVVDEPALNFHVVRVDVLQQLEQLVIADSTVIEVYDSQFFLREVVREQCFEVSRSGCQYYLMGVNLLPFHHKSYVTELLLIQEVNQVS